MKRAWQSPFHKNITDDLYSTGIPGQFDPHLEDASDILNRQFREPGHTLPSIHVGQSDVVMAEAPYQSMAVLDKDQSGFRVNTNFTSSAEQSFQRVIKRASGGSATGEEESTLSMMNAMWPQESSDQNGSNQAPYAESTLPDTEMQDRFTIQDGQMPYDDSRAVQRTTCLENSRLLLATSNHNDAPILNSVVAQINTPPAILADNISPQEAPSMQDVVRRLLPALQAEGYGNVLITGNSMDIGAARIELPELNISSVRLRQNSETSMVLGLELDIKEWSNSFWNDVPPVSGRAGSQLASFTERENIATGITTTNLELMFSQANPSSFSCRSYDDQPKPVCSPNSQALHPAIHRNPSLEYEKSDDDSSGANTVDKGVTYPRHYDDVMAVDSIGIVDSFLPSL